MGSNTTVTRERRSSANAWALNCPSAFCVRRCWRWSWTVSAARVVDGCEAPGRGGNVERHSQAGNLRGRGGRRVSMTSLQLGSVDASFSIVRHIEVAPRASPLGRAAAGRQAKGRGSRRHADARVRGRDGLAPSGKASPGFRAAAASSLSRADSSSTSTVSSRALLVLDLAARLLDGERSAPSLSSG